jgi:hypothetical protein
VSPLRRLSEESGESPEVRRGGGIDGEPYGCLSARECARTFFLCGAGGLSLSIPSKVTTLPKVRPNNDEQKGSVWKR